MSDRGRLNVVLCWHMHQPEYREPDSGCYRQPWTYLHAIKDYVDMAAHLEANPRARAVVNFVPVLLDQLDDYAAQIDAFFSRGETLRDDLLASLAESAAPAEGAARERRIGGLLRANQERLINRFPAFSRLAGIARQALAEPDLLDYLDAQFFADLSVWYHLAWLGETVRRADPMVQALQSSERNFTLAQRHALLRLIGDLIAGVIPRYRALADSGQVELSMTPYAHPIVPLLLDFSAARQSEPDLPLPAATEYVQSADRVCWHFEHGRAVFQRHFGQQPAGCWPSEGGLSRDALEICEEFGFSWAASGEQVLRNSLARYTDLAAEDAGVRYRPYSIAHQDTVCFFRDDALSDAIGFDYASWIGDDAAANLRHRLSEAAAGLEAPERHVAPIILDGENAWEYYPENGAYFLEALYRELAEAPDLNLTTFSDALESGVEVGELTDMVAGSWVYGTFSTWMGHAAKNAAWDLLCAARERFVAREPQLTPAQLEAATMRLAYCEGSDWFWWFGDDNPAGTVADFDDLFRRHLHHLYLAMGEEPPLALHQSIAAGGGEAEAGGVMRRASG